jgi:hypothetical protein
MRMYVTPTGRRTLIVRADSLIARALCMVPMWVPIYVQVARVGQDTTTFVQIGLCHSYSGSGQ